MQNTSIKHEYEILAALSDDIISVMQKTSLSRKQYVIENKFL